MTDPEIEAVVLPPGGAPDQEVADLMAELSKLQTLLTMQMRHGRIWIAAADLVQRTRVLIVERLYPAQPRTALQEQSHHD